MKVVHCKKAKYDVYIGRPSKWGNPFSHREGTLAEHRTATRKEAIERYREMMIRWIAEHPEILDEIKAELKGKTLGCWCAPKACHGDVLLELANGTVDRT